MRRIGFSDRWVALIMECIMTVSYSILVNGEPSNVIHPSRGIRQYDSLSSYLFILYAEGLHDLLHKVAEVGHIRGVSIYKKRTKTNTFVFCR